MTKTIKPIVHLAAVLLVSPLLLIYGCFRLLNPDSAFAGFSQLLSLVPGKTGSYCRVAFFRFAMTRCSSNCVVGFGSLFSQRDTEIGERVYIGPQCNIGSCRIGADCLIASGVHILSGKDQHRFDEPKIPIQQQGGQLRKIVIGSDSWVGNGALVMANIGEKCVIGAGSVVVDDVPDYSVMAGNPARLIRSRA